MYFYLRENKIAQGFMSPGLPFTNMLNLNPSMDK